MVQLERIEAEDTESRAFQPMSDERKAHYLASALQWSIAQIEAANVEVDKESLDKAKHLLRFSKPPYDWATMQGWLRENILLTDSPNKLF